jgi:hypothetical protein
MDQEVIVYMKQHWADLLRTLANETGSMIALWKTIMVLDAIYRASRVCSSVNPVMLVRSWRKHLPDLEEDDLRGFPNKEISKFENS